MYEDIRNELKLAAEELCENAKLKAGDLVAIGCSARQVMGGKIGTSSVAELGAAIYGALSEVFSAKGIYIAAQCCEHLNRALVIEKECAEKYFLERVSVIPQPKAGGSFATATYKKMKEPVLVEHIKAHAGIDVGGTLIGMHLRDVAVPVRLSVTKIGEASIICAYTRPKFIGGERAVYK